jgi:8-oxo-dGTP pyrophosphatase MutT (NUDIX family)
MRLMAWEGGCCDMQLRDCAGGVVFCDEKVFLLKNEKGEWVMPKGVIRNAMTPEETAVQSVRNEGGITGLILDSAGRTYYEFYSITRQRPVCNRVAWFVMKAESEDYRIGEPDKMMEAGFYPVAEALEMITYSQDRSLLTQSYRKYFEKTGRAD